MEKAGRSTSFPLYSGPIPGEICRAQVVFITTVDGAIKEVAGRLASCGFLNRETIVFHCSGASGLDVLDTVRRKGARVGSIHPLQTIPGIEAGLSSLPASYFTLEGDRRAVSVGKVLVSAIGGIAMELPARDRGL